MCQRFCQQFVRSRINCKMVKRWTLTEFFLAVCNTLVRPEKKTTAIKIDCWENVMYHTVKMPSNWSPVLLSSLEYGKMLEVFRSESGSGSVYATCFLYKFCMLFRLVVRKWSFCYKRNWKGNQNFLARSTCQPLHRIMKR